MRHPGRTLCGAAAATAVITVLGTPAASARSFTIVARGSDSARGEVVRIGDFHVGRNAGLDAAIAAFSRPSSRREQSRGIVCRVGWRRLGIKIAFANLGGGGSACKPDLGAAQTGIVRTRRWHTQRGLRVGDRVRA